MAEYREDLIKIPRSAKVTKEGFLSIEDARVARVGVQTYFKDGKTVRELRLPDEVKASVDTFRNSLLTLDHPPELVTVDNAPKYQKGFVPDCEYSPDGWVRAKLHLTDKGAIEAAIATHRQLSCGYTCDIEQTGGIWVDEFGVMGEKGKEYEYDAIQKNIQGNHIALVERARAGDKARFDNDNVIIKLDDSMDRKSMTVSTIKKYKIPRTDEVFEIKADDADDVIAVLDRFQVNIDKEYQLAESSVSLQSEYDGLKVKCDSLDGQKMALETKVAELEKELADLRSSRSDGVFCQSWIKTYEQVKDVLKGDSIDPFSLDEIGLKKAYLSHLRPDLNLDSKSPEFINAAWELLEKPSPTAELKANLDNADPVPQLDTVRGDAQDRTKNLIKLK